MQEYKSFIPYFMRVIIFIKIVLRVTIIIHLKPKTYYLQPTSYIFEKIIRHDD